MSLRVFEDTDVLSYFSIVKGAFHTYNISFLDLDVFLFTYFGFYDYYGMTSF